MTPLATPRSARQAGLSASNSSLLKVVLGLVLVTATVLVSLNASPERILLALDWMAGHRREAVAVFFMAYVIGVVCMMPAMVFGMSAGAIFGVVTGSFISIVASNVGNILAFWAGRYLFRDVVVAYLSGKFPKWALLNAVLSGPESFRLIVLLRLSPIAPWNVLNYLLSITNVTFQTYATASFLAIVPYLVLFVYMGSMARNLASIVTGDLEIDVRYTLAVALISGIALGCLVWYVNRVSRRAMGQTLNESEMSDLQFLDGAEDAEDGGQETTGSTGNATNVVVRDRRRFENDVEIKMTYM